MDQDPTPSTRQQRGLDDATLLALSQELAHAAQTKVPLPLISARYPQMGIEDSYAIQRLWTEGRLEAGAKIAGHKIGLTSRAMQEATGIDEPDYGVIFSDQVFHSGQDLDFSSWSNVRIEVELAFELSRDLKGPGCTVQDVWDATAAIIPALEVLDSHIELKGRSILDTISDNAALGAMVISGRRFDPSDLDLRWVGACLWRNGVVEESGVSGAVLGDPALGIVWLVNKLAAHGEGLSAGEIVLSGSFTRPLWVAQGDEILCQYRGLGRVEDLGLPAPGLDLGEIRCRFR